ncbi:MAG TPA: hypothetical protein VFC34_08455 [Puia sp.]|nr:hypothetical protein [Puia sp.]
MKQKNVTLCAVLIAVCCLSLLLFPACKKSSGSDNSGSSAYYLSATVNGKSWNANYNTNTGDVFAVAEITSSGSVSVVLALGIQLANKDTSAIALVFPKNITLGKAYDFENDLYTAGAYADNSAGYNTSPANHGSGTITVTNFDQTGNIVEGIFSGSFGTTNGSSVIQITNGKFRCLLTTATQQLPPNVKF